MSETKATFLLAMLDMQQSKPMRVNMKEPEELEPMKKDRRDQEILKQGVEAH